MDEELHSFQSRNLVEISGQLHASSILPKDTHTNKLCGQNAELHNVPAGDKPHITFAWNLFLYIILYVVPQYMVPAVDMTF